MYNTIHIYTYFILKNPPNPVSLQNKNEHNTVHLINTSDILKHLSKSWKRKLPTTSGTSLCGSPRLYCFPHFSCFHLSHRSMVSTVCFIALPCYWRSREYSPEGTKIQYIYTFTSGKFTRVLLSCGSYTFTLWTLFA